MATHLRKGVLLALTALLLCLPALPSPIATAIAPTGGAQLSYAPESSAPLSASTDRLPVALDSPLPVGAPVAPHHGTVTALLSFPPANASRLSEMLARWGEPGGAAAQPYLTRAQFDQEFGRPSSAYDAAAAFLAAQPGLSITTFSDRLSIGLQGSAGAMGQLFGAEIGDYGTGSTGYYSIASTPSLPAWLGQEVVQVAGLDNRSRGVDLAAPRVATGVARLAAVAPAQGPPAPVTSNGVQYVFGSDLQVAYDESSLLADFPNASPPVVATLLWGGRIGTGGAALGGFDPTDVYDYFNETLPKGEATPKVYGVPIAGAAPPAPSASFDATGAVAENELDLEMVGAVAPGARIYNVYGPNASTVDLDLAFAYALNPNSSFAGLNNLSVISNSWDARDHNDSAFYTDLQEAEARGISVLAASGDTGNFPNSPLAGPIGNWSAAAFPSTMGFQSFGVTAVGGTTARLNASLAVNQSAWSDLTHSGGPIGSTGGTSSVFAEPAWQSQSLANGASASAGRRVPDVAAIANNTIVTMTIGGHEYHASNASNGKPFIYEEGTSVACPIEAGIVAQIDAVLARTGAPSVGYLAPLAAQLGSLEYKATSYAAPFAGTVHGGYNSSLSALPFLDVRSGHTFANASRQGYDLVTGWGSIDAYNLTVFLAPVGARRNVLPTVGPLQEVGANLSLSSLVVSSTLCGVRPCHWNASLEENFVVANELGAPLYWAEVIAGLKGSPQTSWTVNTSTLVVGPFYGLSESAWFELTDTPTTQQTLPAAGGQLSVAANLTHLGSFDGQQLQMRVGTLVTTIAVPGAAFIIGRFNFSYSWQGRSYTNGPLSQGSGVGALAPQIGLLGSTPGGLGTFGVGTTGAVSFSVEGISTNQSSAPRVQSLSSSVTQTSESASNLQWSPAGGSATFRYLLGATGQGVVLAAPSLSATVPSPSRSSADIGQSVTFSTLAHNGTPSYAYAWSGLPTGCASSNSASLLCQPSGAGSFNVSVTVVDQNGTVYTSPPTAFVVFALPNASAPSVAPSAIDLGQSVLIQAFATPGAGGLTYLWSGLPPGCGTSSNGTDCVPSATGSFAIRVSVTDANGGMSSSPTTSLVVSSDPSVGTPSSNRSSADVGQSVTYSVVVSGGVGPYSVAWSGLPTGCPTTTILVSCAASGSGSYTISVSVQDANGFRVASGQLTIPISTDPTLSSPVANRSSADVGQSVAFTVTVQGGLTPYSFLWSGLPSGCSGASAQVQCSSLSTAGSFVPQVVVTDANGFAVGATGASFRVYADPVAAPVQANRTSADVGQSVTFSSSVTGGSGGLRYTWSGLPVGCAGTTASITCSPSMASSGSVGLAVVDSNAVGATATPLNFRVFADPTVGLPFANRSSADAGQSVGFSVNTSGGSGGDLFGWSGLPSGCTVSGAFANCSGLSAGALNVSVRVTDSNGVSASSSIFAFRVDPDPSVTRPSASVGSVDVGESVTFNVSASGGSGAYQFLWSGLPTGCAGSSESLSCSPTDPGNLSVAVEVTDTNGFRLLSPTLAFVVYADPSVDAPSINRTSADVGQPIALSVLARNGSGGFRYAWSDLPSGCAGNGSTVLCRPTTSTSGSVYVTVTDSNGLAVTSLSTPYVIDADPSVGAPTASRTNADVGQRVDLGIGVTGGLGPFVVLWAGLPSGCNASGLSVSCVPGIAGRFTVEATVTDANDFTVLSGALLLVISDDPSVGLAPPSSTTADVGQTIVLSPTIVDAGSGGDVVAWSANSSVVDCLALANGSFGCRALAPGLFTVTFTVRDANGGMALVTSPLLLVSPDPSVGVPSLGRSTIDAGEAVGLSVSASGGRGNLTIVWTGLPDGCVVSGPMVSCRPSQAGSYAISVVVTDDNGMAVGSAVVLLTVHEAIAIVPAGPNGTSSLRSGSTASFSVAIQGGTSPYEVRWSIGGRFSDGPNVSVLFGSPGRYEVELWVNDSTGATVFATWNVTVLGTGSGSGAALLLDGGLVVVAVLLALGAAILLRRRRRTARTDLSLGESSSALPAEPAGRAPSPPTPSASPAAEAARPPPIASEIGARPVSPPEVASERCFVCGSALVRSYCPTCQITWGE